MKSDDDRIERGDLRRTLDIDGTLEFDFCIRQKSVFIKPWPYLETQ
jgi:hypothetical protein